MTENFDIINMIERNPIARLSKNYENKFIRKIKETFPGKDQQLFVAKFYAYLNYPKTDFVIELDKIWKWIGFERKEPAKRLLNKHFIKDIDYKIVSPHSDEKSKEENKEKIMLTVKTFKKFCLKAGTPKADEIQDYYIKIVDLLFEAINEETNELRNQLQMKDAILKTLNEKK